MCLCAHALMLILKYALALGMEEPLDMFVLKLKLMVHWFHGLNPSLNWAIIVLKTATKFSVEMKPKLLKPNVIDPSILSIAKFIKK